MSYPWLDLFLGIILLGISPLLLGAYGGHVAADSIIDDRKRLRTKFIFWALALVGVVAACLFQIRTINTDLVRQKHETVDHNEMMAAIQTISRPGGNTPQKLADAWGKISSTPLNTSSKAKKKPLDLPTHKEFTAEQLGTTISATHSLATASVINDGTVNAGAFAKQLEIGLRDSGWIVGGDNVHIGDPAFFPDPLTIEVSEIPASTDDHSKAEAHILAQVLGKLGIHSVVRLTDLKFPANFMRIKVAVQ